MTALPVHTLILGAGPAGLTAGYQLARAGVAPLVIVERETVAGGLMRSLRRGQFIVDLGRKELYSRITAVDSFWRGLLGDEYRAYAHRFGSLYRGTIAESSPLFRGFRRGLPWPLFLAGAVDLLLWRVRAALSTPRTYETYLYGRSGRLFSRIIAQGFWEKFNGSKLADMPAPGNTARHRGGLWPFAADRRADPPEWRHPAGGSGQICEVLERGIRAAGGRFELGARVTAISRGGAEVVDVTAETASGSLAFQPRHVVSALPLEVLVHLLFPDRFPVVDRRGLATGPPRSTILVYLFLNEPPRFPHAWLEVTDPAIRAGRITNYAAFSAAMVPPGQTCLCVEYFCVDGDALLGLSPEHVVGLALAECTRARLLDPARCFDHMVVKLPGADAAVALQAWQTRARWDMTAEIAGLANLYQVNQPGTDHATFAGLLAAEAILSGRRGRFDQQAKIDLGTDGAEAREIGEAPPARGARPAEWPGLLGTRGRIREAQMVRLAAYLRLWDTRASGALRVLLYHRVRDPERRLSGNPTLVSATPTEFEAQMKYLRRHYAPVSADQVIAALRREADIPPRAVLVTFDDGYRDVLTDAWPILEQFQIPALLFICSSPQGSAGKFWWDELYETIMQTRQPTIRVRDAGDLSLRTRQERSITLRRLTGWLAGHPGLQQASLEEWADQLGRPVFDADGSILTWEEVRFLAAHGVAVGSHGRTHAALPSLSAAEVADEIEGGHLGLQRELGRMAPLFSFPFGEVDGRAVPLLKGLGYLAGFAASPGPNNIGAADRFALHRRAVNLRHSRAQFQLGLTVPVAAAQSMKLRLRRLGGAAP